MTFVFSDGRFLYTLILFPVYSRHFRSLLVHHDSFPVYDRLIKLFSRENNHFANKNGGDKPMIRPEMRFMVSNLGAQRHVSAPVCLLAAHSVTGR